jgi:hypothetical protein
VIHGGKPQANGNLFNREPQESVVTISKDWLRPADDHGLRPTAARAAAEPHDPFARLQMGRPRFNAKSRTHLQISNPKRAFFLHRQEVDPAPLLQEMGLPAAVEGVADALTGYLNLQCEYLVTIGASGGVASCMQTCPPRPQWHRPPRGSARFAQHSVCMESTICRKHHQGTVLVCTMLANGADSALPRQESQVCWWATG